ncbi:hypothetical protein RIF29_02064 [Crotalaria pallida]|uniref:Uncharacterized protein n=1 Tax=Crotalaria pallida TaxID=3830 RepID=A0AAN9IZD4_CROPI
METWQILLSSSSSSSLQNRISNLSFSVPSFKPHLSPLAVSNTVFFLRPRLQHWKRHLSNRNIKMDHQNPNNTPDGSGDMPLKRKRGRPRKYPRPDAEENSYMLFGQNKKQNPGSGEQTSLPPGYSGNQQLQRDQENGSSDAKVGQVVYGVIEAVFDAGYLLNVRVGDSDTTLRGLVFKPGCYIPISPENDVAPGAPIIQRKEVPFSSGTTQVQTPLSKDRNEQHVIHRHETFAMNGSPTVPQVPRGAVSPINLVASSGKNVSSSSGQTTHQQPGVNMVPVLLQHNNSSNGVPIPNQPSQKVMTQISLGSGAIASKETVVDANQAITYHTQTSLNMLSSSMPSGVVPHSQPSSNVLNVDGANSMRVPSLPYGHLVTKIVKRAEPPSEAMDTDADNSMPVDKIPAKDSISGQEDKANDTDQSTLNNPLHAVQSHPHENSASAPKTSDYPKTGKITELLQILQDNKIENQTCKAAELEAGNKLDDARNLGTELEDGGSIQSTEPF